MTDRLRAVIAVALIGACVLAQARLAARCAAREDTLRAEGFERAHALAAAAVGEARAWGALWLDTEEFLARARRAFDQGHPRNAVLFATRARREARLAVNQARLEAARYFLDHGSRALPAAAARALRERVLAHDGAGAWARARALGAEPRP